MDTPFADLGPRPSGAFADPAWIMSRARAIVLERLSRLRQPVTVAELSGMTGQHPNTLREHLDALVEAGFVARSLDEPPGGRGRGRPALRYEVRPAEEAQPQVREYAHLAGALAGHLSRTSADPQRDAEDAGRHWGRDLVAQDPPAPGADRARHVLAVLDRLGFEPEHGPDGLVLLLRCPLLEAARRQPDVVCHVHLGLVQGVYESLGPPVEGVSLEPFAEPGACRLHLAGAAALGGGAP